MLARLTGALIRGASVGLTLMAPYFFVPSDNQHPVEMVALLAFLAAILVLTEYFSSNPSLIEFRDAPPLNRIRFCTFFLIISLISIATLNLFAPTNLTLLIASIAAILGQLTSVDFTPVHLVSKLVSDSAPEAVHQLVRGCAAVAYILSLTAIALFVAVIRLSNWPARSGPFNVWVNLPFFDPALGADVVTRLQRDAGVNIALGFVLPFVLPLLVYLLSPFIQFDFVRHPQSMIWCITLWAFIPANLAMRGVAMMRVAELIHRKRRHQSEQAVAQVDQDPRELWQVV